MYKIIGADKAEYGPVSGEMIGEWIKQGRANGQTLARLEGQTEWKPLAEFKEFADVLPLDPGAPPVLPTSRPGETKTSGLAIASLVLGVLGWLTMGITSLVGLILGIFALIRISRSRGALSGTGLALAGTITSGAFFLMLPIVAGMFLPALARAKGKAQTIGCMNNMKQLGLGEIMYASDNHDRFSNGDIWCEALGKYIPTPKTFLCPAANPGERCHYAFNDRLSGIDMKKISSPGDTVLLFEVDGGWNLSGGPELALKRPRHQGSIGLVFADGHYEMVKRSRLQKVRWDP
jgi:prepilin-type processing-associated H-X9-DG protein